MKKAIGQTVRELKREVNKKVLKVPGIEQKVLDATSNEPWGPHGSLLADIAMATRNYHEYQMIMTVIWKRLSDTGKNWRHVYKALTVLDYLVGHGSERVIDDIREHAYQISTLSNFQYIDSSGRDQGNNVRKKSQSLVALVNDKERIIEVRQKAAANRDKFRNTSTGGMYRPGSGGYGDKYDYDRYGNRDYDDQNGYGRDREYGYRDDDRYGRYGDSNSRDGDRYGRDYEERYGRDGDRDDDYRGRSRSVDDYQYGTRSRSSDRDRAFDEDGASSRGSGARADDHSQDGRRHERKQSEQNIGGPPSYEEAVSETQSPVRSERVGQTSVAAAPGASPPPPTNNPNQAASDLSNSASPPNQQAEAFDEFDPRGSFSAVASTDSAPAVQQISTSMPTFQPATNQNEVAQPPSASSETVTNFDFGNSFSANAYSAPNSTNSQFLPQEMSTQNQGSAYSQTTQPGIYGQQAQSSANMFSQPTQPSANPYGQPALPGANAYDQVGQPSSNAYSQSVQPSVNPYSQPPQPGANPYSQPAQFNSGNLSRQGSLVPVSSQGAHQITNSPAVQNNNDFLSGLVSQPGSKPAQTVTPSSAGALAIVPQPSKDKFELKSAVWADTLSRGLVNLNISGPKTNPLADIGVDFDALNRKEKRMEKPAPNAVTSTVTMGKAMGSGSGIGRSGASTLRPPANPMMGSSMGSMGMGMGMGGGPVGGMGMGGGYGGMNQQPMGMGMGMGMNNMGMNPGMGMNMGMGQRPQMQGMPGGYNPMMGSGSYSQQPYGGGYR
ncbi:Clathrin interactor EPSIN 2 -like protein [Gossypium arboreum]|uniref:Clathrin interactor EPSIN 2-like protein n=1 Tax=Gossypium arboreum TaxID=29729 RepID=A0A0B0MEG4_GOSAR|nr:Clathrin interactor EPSIN 2 -like protein [Gossypium arboreum]